MNRWRTKQKLIFMNTCQCKYLIFIIDRKLIATFNYIKYITQHKKTALFAWIYIRIICSYLTALRSNKGTSGTFAQSIYTKAYSADQTICNYSKIRKDYNYIGLNGYPLQFWTSTSTSWKIKWKTFLISNKKIEETGTNDTPNTYTRPTTLLDWKRHFNKQ